MRFPLGTLASGGKGRPERSPRFDAVQAMDQVTASSGIFARNLRRICAETASIAEICRDTGINRQQFNKYLSGKSTPSTRTLRKICERLDITETELFAPFAESPQEDIAQAYHTDRLGREFDRLIKLFMPPNARGVSSGEIPLKPGRYFCYFAFPDHPELILRSFIQVWQRNDMLAFACLTRDRGLSQAPRTVVRGRHYGVVISTGAELSMVALNRAPPHQTSMVNLSTMATYGTFRVGVCVTRAANGPVACRAVLQQLSDRESTKVLLARCGILPATDKSIPDVVVGVMTHAEANPAAVGTPSADDIAAAMVTARP